MNIRPVPEYVKSKWSAAEYLEAGICSDDTMIYVVCINSSPIVYSFTRSQFAEVFEQVEPPKPPTPTSIDDILRIIAVTQDPSLMKDKL